MKQLIDTVTQELPLGDSPPVKRGRGRPPTGTAMTAAERQAKRRQLLRDAGLVSATVTLPVEVAEKLDKFIQFKDVSKGDVVAKALRNSIMRSR